MRATCDSSTEFHNLTLDCIQHNKEGTHDDNSMCVRYFYKYNIIACGGGEEAVQTF